MPIAPISVIIPSRGDSAHLRAAIHSADQAGADEIVVALPKKIPTPASLSGQMIQVETLTGNVADQRNAALQVASAPRVAFLDDDDLYEPHHLRELQNLFELNPTLCWGATRVRTFLDSTASLTAQPPGFMEEPGQRESIASQRSITGIDGVSGLDSTDEGDPSHAVATLPRDAQAQDISPILPLRHVPQLTLSNLLEENRVFTPAAAVDRDRLGSLELKFDPSFPVMEDYELWLRLAEHGPGFLGATPTVWVRRRAHSLSRDPKAMAIHSIRILERYESKRDQLDIRPSDWNVRKRNVWMDLAWAELAYGTGSDARAALRAASTCGASGFKPFAYWAASWLPKALRPVTR